MEVGPSPLDQLVTLLNSASFERKAALDYLTSGGTRVGEMAVVMAQARRDIARAFAIPESLLGQGVASVGEMSLQRVLTEA